MPIQVNNSEYSSAAVTDDRRPEQQQLTRCQKFRLFCYNKEKKTYCGRTCINWGKILLFYFVFLSICIILFAVCLLVYVTIIGKQSAWASKQDLISPVQPGLGFFPNIANKKSPLIYYDWNKKDPLHKSYRPYIQEIIYNLRVYREWEKRPLFHNCWQDVKKPCRFPLSDLGPCGVKGIDKFGYKSNKPCIYITLNDVVGWEPEFYDLRKLPTYIPAELEVMMTQENDTSLVWLYCEGVNAHDKEHLGKISYYPRPGYNSYYYPYKINSVYMSPIVAIKLNELKRGYLITIRCTAYASNIKEPFKSRIEIQLYIPLNINQRVWPPP